MPSYRQSMAAAVSAAACIGMSAAAQGEEAPASPPLAFQQGQASAAATRGGLGCSSGICQVQLTAPQLLTIANKLVLEKRYSEARPLIDALRLDSQLQLEWGFLDGLVALETGDLKTAEKRFRAILKDLPGQTRVRLELARVLFAKGEFSSVDYHLRLAQQDEDLPEDIARIISNTRSVIKSKRNWRFGFDFGFAPDSNINSATSAETVDVNIGQDRLALTLNDEARARSGLGLTASMYGSLRLPAGESLSVVVDADAQAVRFEEKAFNDSFVQLAVGPEFRLGERTTLSLQALGAQRWFGGKSAVRQLGSQVTVQRDIARDKRIAVQLDVRYADSAFGKTYSGWQAGANATYEQVVAKSMIASGSLYLRRDDLGDPGYSSTSYGANVGIGGEFPWGFNAGISAGIGRSQFDSPLYFFSSDSRSDWRFNGRAFVGLRQYRLMGFSPSVEVNVAKNSSNYDLYSSDRTRAEFKLARYF